MQTEVLRRHPDMSAETARAHVHNALDDLATQLERVLYLGSVPKEVERAYAVCLDAEKRALSLLAPGTRAKSLCGAD